MRATTCALIGALTLTATGAAAADNMSNMPGMSAAPVAKHGKGVGVIRAIDAKAGTLTIQHGPIPSVSWPAMTMTFKAKPASLLTGLRVGQTVGFDTTVRGVSADVTAVRPQELPPRMAVRACGPFTGSITGSAVAPRDSPRRWRWPRSRRP